MNILTQNNQQSMTSQQIADLVGSRHDVVRKSIERLATDKPNKPAVIQLPPVTEVKQNQSLSPNSKTVVYVFSGEQGKRDSFVVVAQLSPEFTGALVDRWQELEQQVSTSNPVTPALPNFTNPADAAIAWAEEYKAKEAAQAEVIELKPKAEALARISSSKGATGIRDTAKAVGMRQNDFVAWCVDDTKPISRRFMYRDDRGVLNAYSHRTSAGLMTQKLQSFVGHDGRDRAEPRVKFTPAGVAKIAEMLEKERNREAELV
jgi:phage regulator Rha-like protein